MNLEHELRALSIAFPDEPDLAPRVLARLERPTRRWWLGPALVALAVAGALFAIPQTRAAILDLFRIGGVEVRRVETQPRAPVRDPVLGREVSLATAQRRADFPLLVPGEDNRLGAQMFWPIPQRDLVPAMTASTATLFGFPPLPAPEPRAAT